MLPIVQLDNKGLYTFANLLSQVPPGAMTVADNVNIDRPGIAETRRGFEFYGNVLPSPAIRGFIYADTLLWYLQNGSLVYDSGAGVWVTYAGSYFPPTNSFLNSTQSSGNFYFTTNNGVYKLDSVTNQPRQSGVPAALDLQGAISGAGNAVNNNSQVGYQAVFGYTDANNNLILGAPSEFLFVSNTAGSTQNVNLSITVPNNLTTSHFLQIYRTANTGSLSVPPGNNFQLALVHQLTSGDLTAGVVTLTDAIPDTLLGAFIYTADGQPSNFPNNAPPLCLDVCTYQGMTFYANYSTIQTANITLDAVGPPNGVQIGDTISITDIAGPTTYTYTGAAANNFPLRQFKVDTGGTIAQNIDATARNLVACINQDPANTLFYARYLTGENILPGEIVLEAQAFQNGQFYVNSSRQTCWTPSIPASGQTYISDNNARPNGMLISKVNQPEAVPAAYELLLQAGNTNITIFRVIALQDAVYAFTSGGIFRITGSDPTTLQTLLFDSSAQILGLATPQVLNNSIFYMSTQGVCSVSSGGNQILSRNIERDILGLAALPTFPSVAFGTSYESDRKYLLYTPTDEIPAESVQNYVYNWITQTWTLWTRPTTAAIVNTAVDRLFISDSSGNVFEERKSFTNNDYADQSYTVTVVSTDPGNGTITLTDSSNVQINDVIRQTVGLTEYSTQVTGNNLLTDTLTVLDATGYAAGSATVYRSIATEIQYTPITCGFAEYVKKFSSWQFMFSNADFNELLLNMSSDFYPAEEEVVLSPVTFGGWGTLPWGTAPWGVSTVPEQVIPTWPTKNTGYAHWVILNLRLSQAFTALALDGVSATYEVTSTRGR